MLSSAFSPRRWYCLALNIWCVIWLAMPMQLPLWANPSGGTVAGGAANISTGPGQVTVNQSSQRAIVNWRSFSINKGETTTFVQPNSSSATLNRVTGGDMSQINGRLNANGRVYLVNPNGVVIGKSGRVNTGSFTASTSDVSDAQFMKGKDLNFRGDSSAKVVNYGKIKATDGDVTLIARQVENHGKISAKNGRAQLAAGTEVLIKSEGAERVYIMPGAKGAPGQTGIINTGKVNAAVAELKAAGGNEYALAINNTGVIRANGTRTEGGRVYLSSTGGRIVNGTGGKIRAVNQDGSGGEVRVAGGKIELKSGSVIDASARKTPLGNNDAGGKGGTILIGGEARGQGTMEQAQAVTVDAGAELLANAASTPGSSTPYAGGKVVVWSTGLTDFSGSISASGTSNGPGGWVETSGHDLNVGLATTIITGGGEWLLDPVTLDVVATGGTATLVGATNDPTTATSINASTIVSVLNSGGTSGTTVTLNASSSITVSTAISALRGTLVFAAPTVNLNAIISGVTGIQGSGVNIVNVGLAGRIQNGIAAVTDGGTINLAAGSFTERISIAGKSLSLLGGVGGTSIDGSSGGTVVSVTAAGKTVTMSGLIITKGSGSNGGGINIVAGTVTINNSTITSNAASSNGGGIYIASGATANINSSTVSSNTAGNSTTAGSGGGVYNTGGTLNIKSASLITLNSITGTSGNGGGIYSNSNVGVPGSVTIEDSSVTFNTAKGNGGGITINGSALIIKNSHIDDNTTNTLTTANGGGINLASGTADIQNSFILRNKSATTGGGISMGTAVTPNAASATITNTLISGNTLALGTAGGGGGIYSNTSAITIIDSTISTNTGFASGGGLYLSGTTAITSSITGSTISGNTALTGGAGIYSQITLNIDSTTISGNTTSGNGDGGGIYNTAGTLTLQNLSYVTGNTTSGSGRGAGIFSVSSSLTLKNQTYITFNTTTTGQGGGIFISNPGSTFDIRDSFITGNTAPPGSGGFYSNVGTGSFLNTVIKNNHVTTALAIGGGGLSLQGGTFSITDSFIQANDSADKGAGIYIAGGIVTITNTDISGNINSGALGGGVYNSGGTVVFNGGNINNNKALTNGGGIYNTGSITMKLNGVTVSGNSLTGTSGNSGGGIYNPGVMEINGSTISNNSTGTIGQGGGITTQGTGAALTLKDSFVTGNMAVSAGAGLVNTGLTNVEIINTEISGNTNSGTGSFGAGVYSAAAVLKINTGSKIINNSTGQRGGGVYVISGTVTLKDTIISNNKATETASRGGGIYIVIGTTDMTNMLIDNNISGSKTVFGSSTGGGVYNDGGTVTITSSIISNNFANSEGGGVYNNNTTLTIRTSTLNNNSLAMGTLSKGGGALYHNLGTGITTIEDSSLYGNTAVSGGAITLNSGGVTIRNSTIANNSASDFGGGISTLNGALILENVTISGNTATNIGGGIAATKNVNTLSLKLTNTIVAGNTASATAANGKDIFTSALNVFTDNGNNLIGAIEGIAGTPLKTSTTLFPDTYTQVGTFASPLNPRLAPLANYGGPTLTMALLPGSPALGRGPTLAAAALDQRGITRPSGQKSDIGAFESQGFTYTATSGSGQSAQLTAAFGSPLVVTISSNDPGLTNLTGSAISLTVPGSGASATGTLSGTANAYNQVSFNLTANSILGTYSVAVTQAPTTLFTLSNVPINLTILPNSGQGKIYGNTTPTITFGVSAGTFLTGDSIATLIGLLAYSGGENAGNHAITLGTLTSANNPNYNITLDPTTVNFLISQRAITINPGTGQSKLYGNLDPTLTYTVTGGLGETLSGALAYSGGPNVGNFAITLGNLTTATNPNYIVSLNSTPVTFAINQRVVTILPTSGQFKKYGSADPASFAYTVGGDGVAGSEVLNGNLAYTGGPNVGNYAFNLGTVTTASNPNYAITLNSTPVNFEIRQRVVTIDPTTGQGKKYGFADPTITYTVGGDGVAGVEVLNGSLIYVGGPNVGNFPIALGSVTTANNPNYAITLNSTPVTFAINQRVVTILPTSGQFKKYGSADSASFAYTVGGDGVAGTEVLNGNLAYTGGPNVGNYPFTLGTVSTAFNPNYAITLSSTPVNFEIRQRVVTIDPNTGQGKKYGFADPTITYAVGGDGVAGVEVLNGALTYTGGPNVGSFPIALGTVTTANNPNYAITLNSTPVTFAINQRVVTILPTSGQFKKYGFADPASFAYTVGGDGVAGSEVLNGDLAYTGGPNVGNYAFNLGTVTTAFNPNYAITLSSTPVNFEIRQRVVTIDPTTGQGKKYGFADPTITYDVGGDGVAGVEVLNGALTYTGGPNVGNFPIALGSVTTANNPNYAITLNSTPVTFAINQRLVTITPRLNQGKVYGDSDPALTYDITGDGMYSTELPTGALDRAPGSNVGNYAINQGTLGVTSNYALTFVSGIDFAIARRAVTVNPTAGLHKLYGTADPELTFTVTNVVGTETLNGDLAYAGGPNVGTFAIGLGTVTTANNPNYTVSLNATPVTFTIDPRSLIINPTAGQNKLYDDADPTFTYSVTGDGLYGTDSLSGNLGRAGGANVNTYAYNLGTLAASPSVNYVVSLAPVAPVFTINPRSIVVTPNSGQNKNYGALNPATYTFTQTGDGFRNGDNFSGQLSRNPGEAAGYYQITQGNLAVGSNYALTFASTPVFFTINGVPITVTPNFGQGRYYGDTDPEITYTMTSGSLVPGDTFTGALAYTGGPNVGAYAITQGTLATAPSYLVTFDGSVLFNIRPRPVTITPNLGQGKIYGFADPSQLTYEVGGKGLVGSDTLSGNLGRAPGEHAGSYAINRGTLSASANYALSFVPGILFNIAPRGITVAPDSGQKKFVGETDPELTYTVSNGSLVAGDSLAGNLSRVSGEAAGNYLILAGDLSATSDYLLTFSGVPVDFQILPSESNGNGNGGGGVVLPGNDANIATSDLAIFNSTHGRNNEDETYYTGRKPKSDRTRQPTYSGVPKSHGLYHMSSYELFGKGGQISQSNP